MLQPLSIPNAPAAPASGTMPGVRVMTRNPMVSIGFLALASQLFIYHTRFFDVALTGFKIPIITFVLSVAMLLVSGRVPVALRSPIGLFLIGMVGWWAMCVPTSIWRSNSVSRVTIGIQAVILFLEIVAFIADRGLLMRAVKLIALCTAFSATVALVIEAPKLSIDRLAYSQGTFADPNEFATWLLIGVPMMWLWFNSTRSAFGKALCVLATPVILWALLKTGSRGGMIAFAILGLGIFFTVSLAKKVLIVSSGALVVVSALTFLPAYTTARYRTFFSNDADAEVRGQLGEAVGSSENRWQLLRESLLATIRYPIFGQGPGNFGEYHWNKYKAETGNNTPAFTPHNTYTQISSESGVPGVALFLCALIATFRLMSQVPRLRTAAGQPLPDDLIHVCYFLRMSLLALCGSALFLSLAYSGIFFIIMGLSAAAYQVAMQELYAAGPAVNGAGVGVTARTAIPGMAIPSAAIPGAGLAGAGAMPVPVSATLPTGGLAGAPARPAKFGGRGAIQPGAIHSRAIQPGAIQPGAMQPGAYPR